ncbi:MAG: hypothetical protein K2L96_06225, partial [Muribaculaceae bacterium]|nr:hypothetical protein [Muribaculaceae bacterium]
GDMRVGKCRGLRPCETGSGLEACRGLEAMRGSEGMVPVCVLRGENGCLTLLRKGTTLYSCPGLPRADVLPMKVLSFSFPSTPVCVEAQGDEATVMCENATTGHREVMRLKPDGNEPRVLTRGCDYPALQLTAIAAGTVVATVGSRSIDNDTLAQTQLTREKAAQLSGDLATAYQQCTEAALASGAYIQAAFAAYRLLDENGRTLYESRPLLLTRDMDYDSKAGDYREVSMDANGTLQSYSLELEAWRPMLTVPEGFAAAAPDVARIELLLGEQFHPYHPDAAPEARRTAHGSFRGVAVALPGHYRGLSKDRADQGRRLLEDACGAFKRMAHCAGVMSTAALTGKGELRGVAAPEDTSVAGSVRRMEKAVRETARSVGKEEFGERGRLWARTSAHDAGRILWGNLRELRKEAPSPGSLAVEWSTDSSKHWRANVTVKFRGNAERTVAEYSGTGPYPTKLSPVLSFSDADAREMRVQILCGTRIFDRRFALEADPAGKMAIYVNDSFLPIDCTATQAGLFETETEQNPGRALPGSVAVAKASNPLEVLCSGYCGGSGVKRIVAGRSGHQAWEFGRHRFVAQTDEGLFAISAGDKSMSIRQVWAGRAEYLAAAGSKGTYSLCGKRLLRVGPTGAVSVSDTPEAGRYLCYEAEGQHLIAGSWIYDMAHEVFYENPALESTTESYMPDGTALIADGSARKLLIAGSEMQQDLVEIAWEATLEHRGGAARPRRVYADMSSSFAELTVEMDELSSDGTLTPMGRWSIAGNVRGPICLRVNPRRAVQGRIKIRIKGSVNQDFVFRGLELDYER